MVTHVDVDVPQLWRDYRAEPTTELRNQLVELYLPLVKYNAERIWARLPEGPSLSSARGQPKPSGSTALRNASQRVRIDPRTSLVSPLVSALMMPNS